MLGRCPQCDKGEGVSVCKDRVQHWSPPQSLLSGPVPVEIAHLVPCITMGQQCGHTISLSSWKEHNGQS